MNGERSELVLDLLADGVTRCILAALDEPMTTQEIADTCEIPRSTAYRKVDRLQTAGLVTDRIRVSPDGRHPTLYSRASPAITLRVNLADRRVDLDPPSESQDRAANESHEPPASDPMTN